MKNLILNIIDSPTTFARFLNTLSLLEYVGARKILKSQKYEHLNEKILGHAVEELRHAQVLKRASKKLAPMLCDSYDARALLCGNDAYHYFQTVDLTVEHSLDEKNVRHAYLYTTYLVEIRAIDFYTLCEQTLLELGKPSVFRGILVEEKSHLDDVLNDIKQTNNYEEKIKQLKISEAKAFQTFLTSIGNAVGHQRQVEIGVLE